jgi:hypothetical protein
LPYSYKDEPKKCLLKNVCVLAVLKESETMGEFIVSKSLISTTREINKEKYQKGYLYFYLKPNINYATLTSGIYITTDEIPEELKPKNK